MANSLAARTMVFFSLVPMTRAGTTMRSTSGLRPAWLSPLPSLWPSATKHSMRPTNCLTSVESFFRHCQHTKERSSISTLKPGAHTPQHLPLGSESHNHQHFLTTDGLFIAIHQVYIFCCPCLIGSMRWGREGVHTQSGTKSPEVGERERVHTKGYTMITYSDSLRWGKERVHTKGYTMITYSDRQQPQPLFLFH